MVLHIRDPKNLTRALLETIRKLNQCVRIHLHNPLAQINSFSVYQQQIWREGDDDQTLIHSSHKMKYLKIILITEMRYLYIENCKLPNKEIVKDTHELV